jgi:hypothetical protein
MVTENSDKSRRFGQKHHFLALAGRNRKIYYVPKIDKIFNPFDFYQSSGQNQTIRRKFFSLWGGQLVVLVTFFRINFPNSRKTVTENSDLLTSFLGKMAENFTFRRGHFLDPGHPPGFQKSNFFSRDSGGLKNSYNKIGAHLQKGLSR